MLGSSLRDLYQAHQGKVSDKWASYLREYDRILAEFRGRPVRLLEIGIQNGGSLEIWGKYFPAAVRLIGCDIDPACSRLAYEDHRVVVIVADANLDSTEQAVLSAADGFEVIIDDGSHKSGDIVRTFARYFRHLEPGGVFIAEDLHCSYWREFEGGLFHPASAITFFKHLADVVNHEHWGVPRRRSELLAGLAKTWDIPFDDEVLKTIGSVEFVNSICVVRRQNESDGSLGLRIVAGTEAAVAPEILALANGLPLSIDQSENPWSNRLLAPAEELIQRLEELDSERAEVRRLCATIAERDSALRKLNLDLQSRDQELAQRDAALAERDRLILEEAQAVAEAKRVLAEERDALRNRAAEVQRLQQSIDALYASTSWRITGPLRALAGARGGAADIKRRLDAVRRSQGGLRGAARYALRRLGPGRPPSQPHLSSDDEYRRWIARTDAATADRQAEAPAAAPAAEGFSGGACPVGAVEPTISIVMPVYNTSPGHLAAAFSSVLGQTQARWELCIVDDCSTDAQVRAVCEWHAAEDPRIRFQARPNNGGIVAATNTALELVTGDFVCFLDHDDQLHPMAIRRLVQTVLDEPEADLIYTDEDKIDDAGRRCEPFFKPDWSPHLAISQGYLGHLVCYRRSLVASLGGLREQTNGAQDYDLWLRASLKARCIVHIPEVLYHWRLHEGSTALRPDSKPYAHEAGQRAVSHYLASRYPGIAIAVEDGPDLFCYRARFELAESQLISIVIPTRDRADLLKGCIDSIRGRSGWQNFEIIVIDNGSIESRTATYLEALQRGDRRMRVVRADVAFNWSKLNNLGAAQAKGEVLVFLNNDTEVQSEDWLQSLAGYAMLPDVGAVGGLLFFEDGTIQHAGVVVGMGGWADHVFRLMPAQHRVGPFVSPVLTRNALAVTGACMAIERRKFIDLGGFDEDFVICGSDVEIGLRAHRRGLFNVVCTEARLLHYESKSRSPKVPENDFIQSELKYRPYRTEAVDPFYNPNLSLTSTCPVLARGGGSA